ncbi:selenium metabolism-associated LysR family transcriptional regulator [Paenibacillus thalictri]|uniref:LysR family transcriptional regulator n=1 Tax=Paenibacillus thalictri TaxID=2527873 RepID=A0A4Q9DM10_9BACL|nr:selenium metabolism-associated LysR family transcriptional regulator [Paenibacillus thalictri]TBL76325.1 LysR family transcriptional regulator [Paenibacillus thalictri]
MLLHQLEVFTHVAERCNFSKAAEALFLSQSTVSSHIKNLEAHFGQKLFDRLGKEVVLTPFGKKLYPWAREMLMLKDKVLWEIKDWTGKVDGILSIIASAVPAQYAIPFLLSQFLKKYNGVKFSLEQGGSETVAEKLLKGEAEIGLLGEQYHQDQLTFIPFVEEKLVLITPLDLELHNGISISEIVKYPFLFRKSNSGTQAHVEKMLSMAGIKLSQLQVAGYFGNMEALKASVREGIGISIISSIAVLDWVNNKYIHAYELAELPEKRMFYFAHHKQRTLSPLAEAFIHFSLQLAGEFSDRYRINI